MKNIDAHGHVRGKSVFLDDIATLRDTLYGAVLASPVAHGRIEALDFSVALAQPGVVAILTHRDIPGENQIGAIIQDEPLLAEAEVHYQGQPIALVVADTERMAREARRYIQLQFSEQAVITCPREAQRKNQLLLPARTFCLGDTSAVWAQCAHVFSGQTRTNGQEHLYLETQGAYAMPMENGNIRIASSTQGPTALQRAAGKVLDMGMHKIEVDVVRLGGGFGGKEDQATPWGVLAALAAQKLQKPVKIVLHRMDDMRMTGKRHPYEADYKIGLSADLKVIAFEARYFQNAGAAADLSPAILGRTLFHGTNSYYIPHVRLTAYSCQTHLPPNTAFRGFGAPQGMFVIEAALAHAAYALGVPTYELQKRNLLQEGDEFPYGQKAQGVGLTPIWADMESKFDLLQVKREIQHFNERHEDRKKGFALMPITFGVSFTNTPMNQARALVHIYSDGSVGISTGAVEMGQGVNTKLLQVAARIFSIDPSRIKIESTNTTRVANTSPSAASSTADLNGKALQKACRVLLARLKQRAAKELNARPEAIELLAQRVFLRGKETQLDWTELVKLAFLDRLCLTETAHYASPLIHFDATREKGHPFLYHVFGLALTEVSLDCIRGTYEIDAVKIVHDFGQSMNPGLDRGQIEGGLVQGLGWMTMEEIHYDEQGRLLSNSLSTYKIPDLYSAPKEVLIEAWETEGTELAILKSKAVGEPPLMYGIGVYFAIEHAIRAFNPGYDSTFDAPFTPEKVLMALYS
jgi:xanthine dehydrogenase large subunit